MEEEYLGGHVHARGMIHWGDWVPPGWWETYGWEEDMKQDEVEECRGAPREEEEVESPWSRKGF